jgi:Flp pilus assembly protein TadG
MIAALLVISLLVSVLCTAICMGNTLRSARHCEDAAASASRAAMEADKASGFRRTRQGMR